MTSLSIVTSLLLVVAASAQESGCPPGMEFVFDRCLQKHSMMLHHEAKALCQAEGHEMVMPETEEFYEAFMKWDEVKGDADRTEFWMGISNRDSANETDYYWEYDLKKPVTWSIWEDGQPKPMEDRCAVLNRRDLQWTARDCNKFQGYAVCESEPFKCPAGFYFVHDRCVAIMDRLTHPEAKALCEEKGYEMIKPDSAAFYNVFIEWAGKGDDIMREYWMGISNQGSDPSGYHWEDADKTPVTWANWRSDQPTIAADRCVLSKDKDTSWLSQKCSTKKAQAVCQAESRECPIGFEKVKGRCLQKYGKMTHNEAKELCESNGYTMVIAGKTYLEAFLSWEQVQDEKEQAYFWMGVSNQDSEDVNDFYWEKTIYKYVTWGAWGKNNPSNKRDRCVAANNRAKAWVDRVCRESQAVAVCQAPYTPCPEGFDLVEERCMRRHKKSLKLDDAITACLPYKLYMPKSKEDYQALLQWNQIKYSWQPRYWIGASNRGEEDPMNYHYEDAEKTPLEYAPWGKGHPKDNPKQASNRCAQFNKYLRRIYSWKCDRKRAWFVCETPKNY